MTIEKLQKIAAAILSGDINCVTKDNAVSPEFIGLRFFDSPVFGVANSDDPQFEMLREPGVVDQESLLPRDILPASKSVISWFLPFTAKVRNYNREDMFSPSDVWLQARIEGQEANFAIGEAICRQLETEGYCVIQPSCSNKFKNLTLYCSNWSERHVAYIAGLGTFGLSKGLITEKGLAGRFGSVVTDAKLPPAQRPYKTPFEYCTMCGACAKNCPAGAIDPSKGISGGKDHVKCAEFLKTTKKMQRCGFGGRMRYGCGKCQVGVPCEYRIPVS